MLGAILWGTGIWWIVANLSGGIVPQVESDQAAADEVAVLRAKVNSLIQQTSTLTADRDALAKRMAALEARPAQTSIAAPKPDVVGADPPIVSMNLEATPAEYSIPRFAYRGAAAPSTATAPLAAPASTSGSVPAATAAPPSRFFTNGADKYNCTSFASQAEAQKALAANAPGDPNRMDMNANGVACEDIAYAVNTPRNVTPIANR